MIAPGDYVAFSVTDDGAGVPTEIIDWITQPFLATKTDGKGTVLGLPMVLAFARQAGGGLLLSSSPGRTRFDPILPAILSRAA